VEGVGQRYVPAGDDPYVVRRNWRDAVLMLVTCAGVGVLAAAVGGAFGVGVGIAGAVAAIFWSMRCWMATGLASRSPSTGGVYFGRWPRELIPWSEITEVELYCTRTSIGGGVSAAVGSPRRTRGLQTVTPAATPSTTRRPGVP
jgi:hypothetical protein